MASSLVLSRKKEGISSTNLQSALVQAPLLLKHQPAGQLKRTRPLTSYPVSQSRSFLPTHEAGHVFAPTRKVGSAFFRTHVYCDYSPCFADPAQNANTDVIPSQPIACPSEQSRSRSRVFTDQEGRKCVLQNSRLL